MNDPVPPFDRVRADADLVHRWGPVLVLFARSRCNCAEDVVQETFLKLFRMTERPSSLQAWLFRVVRNEAANAFYLYWVAKKKWNNEQELLRNSNDVFQLERAFPLDLKFLSPSPYRRTHHELVHLHSPNNEPCK